MAVSDEDDGFDGFVEYGLDCRGEIVRGHRSSESGRRTEPRKVERDDIKSLTQCRLKVSMSPTPTMERKHSQWCRPMALAKELPVGEGAQHGAVGTETTDITAQSNPTDASMVDRAMPVSAGGYGGAMENGTPPTADPFARLTTAQREAVFATDDKLCVYAGAGAGKTRVLTLRAARLVDEGVDPAHLLVLTFSRKAAQELRTRLWQLGIEGVRAGTFHRTALELIEIRRAELGLPPARLIADRPRALERVADSVAESKVSHVGMVLDTEITWAKSHGLEPEEYPSAAQQSTRRTRVSPDVIALVWDAYERNKARQGFVDFDDLILEATAALDDPGFASAIHWRSRHLLIDEFQDVNPSQFRLIERLLSPTTTLFCVGDPNQSIYGFNGADASLLRTLDTSLPGTRVLALDTNHRSTPEIVNSAIAVLPEGDQRTITTTQQPGPIPELMGCGDDDEEANFVARRAQALKEPSGRWKSMAVLARTNAQLERFETAFASRGIPTVRLAPDLARASDVKDSSTPRPGQPAEEPIDGVALGTFHRAKGLEWPTVFVVGVSDGFVPHVGATTPEAKAEEQRLLYVALTRAERALVVTWAERKDATESTRMPSRARSPFLDPFERHLSVLQAERRPSPSTSGAARASQLRQALEARKAQKDETAELS